MTVSAQAEQERPFQYQKQYSHVYSQRLNALRPRCWKSFLHLDQETTRHNNKNNNNDDDIYTRINRVLELREDIPSRIVGTLVKETTDPDEATMDHTKCRPSDTLFLEDESGRVVLDFDTTTTTTATAAASPHDYCTGVVVGIQGKVDNRGVFHVEALAHPAPASPAPLLPTVSLVPARLPGGNQEGGVSTKTVAAPHLLLVSSLLCGDPHVPSLPREMLVSYLSGQFTRDAAKVCRVLILGGGPSSQEPLLGVKELDAFLCHLTHLGIPVDILPGSFDPTTANWPQRPLHSSLLPASTSMAAAALVHRTPNPYAAVLGPQWVVATDGANVHDLQQYITTTTTGPSSSTTAMSIDENGGCGSTSSLDDNDDDEKQDKEPATPPRRKVTQLEALTRTLEWSHLCPTGPNSLPTVPHMEQDPMVLDHLPNLYVCGNADHFAKATTTTTTTTTLNGTSTPTTTTTTLVCVPKFSETGEAVLVNLETLALERLRFLEE
jgi:DNA polymerase delta subunit 2